MSDAGAPANKKLKTGGRHADEQIVGAPLH